MICLGIGLLVAFIYLFAFALCRMAAKETPEP